MCRSRTPWYVRILEHEALAHERLLVQRHAVQVQERLGIDEYADIAELENAVALAGLGVELNRVAQARAAAALHAQAQAALGADALLGRPERILAWSFLRHRMPLDTAVASVICLSLSLRPARAAQPSLWLP